MPPTARIQTNTSKSSTRSRRVRFASSSPSPSRAYSIISDTTESTESSTSSSSNSQRRRRHKILAKLKSFGKFFIPRPYTGYYMGMTLEEYERMAMEHPDHLELERAAYNIPYIF